MDDVFQESIEDLVVINPGAFCSSTGLVKFPHREILRNEHFHTGCFHTIRLCAN